MKKIRAAVVGYGNIGKYTIQALEAAPDFEIAGAPARIMPSRLFHWVSILLTRSISTHRFVATASVRWN